MLKDKIARQEGGYLFYGITPPKLDTEEEKIRLIANKQIERLQGTGLDGLILYDIQDESSRTDIPRPFPFMETMAPEVYSRDYLANLDVSKIIYKSVGKYSPEEFSTWLTEQSDHTDLLVLVGSPSKNQKNKLSLEQAYQLKQSAEKSLLLGGVTIPERHAKKEDEHLRLFHKMEQGCDFFVSQCVYNLDKARNFLSDYYYGCQEKNIAPVPIIFTLTPCGSIKTLQFMEWLGIDIPRWLKNDLLHSNDILAKSVRVCKKIAKELIKFSNEKNMPIGFNIESVAIRKEEIEASIELLATIQKLQQVNA